MSEYKENTVGWWLSHLKEPLRSKAFVVAGNGLDDNCNSMKEAIGCIHADGEYSEDEEGYWMGVFGGVSNHAIVPHLCSDSYMDGYYDVLGWSPKPKDGGEDKAIVDSPAPEVWGEKIPIGSFEFFCKGMDRDIPLPKLSSEELLKLNDCPKILYDETFLYPGESPKPKDSWEVEPAVVGYQVPLPIDTIEKKHELRIKNLEAYNKYRAERDQRIMDLNPHVDFYDSEGKFVRPSRISALEARVKELEGVVGKLEQQIEYVYRNLPKDFDGTR